MVLSLATSIVLTRALQPDGRGVYALILFFASVMTYYSTFGIGQSTIFFMGKGGHSASVIVGNTIMLSFVLSSVAATVGVLIIRFFSHRFFPSVEPRFLWVVIALIPFQHLFTVMIQMVLAIHDYRAYNMSRLFQAIFTLLAMILLLGCWKVSVLTAVGVEFASIVLVCAQLWYVLWRGVGRFTYRIHLPYVRSALRFGFSSYLGSTLLLFHNRVDLFLINLFMTATQVGFYSLSASLSEKVTVFSDSVSTLLFPRLAGEQDRDTVNSFTPLLFRTVFLFMLGFGGLLFLLGGLIILLLYGTAYAPSITPLRILIIGTIASGAWGVLESDFKSRGFPLLGFFTTLGSTIVNVVLNCLWIPRYGIIGAAGASAISYTFSLVLGLVIYCRLTGISGWEVVVPQKRDFVVYGDVLGRLWREARS
jgi:O-antigen/teichoic acid export membrane protein